MTLSTFKRLFQEYQESGLNVKDFCANQDFAPSTFYYWKKQLEDPFQHPPQRFVPLVLDAHSPDTGRRTFQAPIKGAGASINNTSLEFVFPNGTRMVIKNNVDIGLLKAIAHLFD